MIVTFNARRAGKTIAAEKLLRDFTRANPTAMIARHAGAAGWIIEKPVTAADLVPELTAPAPGAAP